MTHVCEDASARLDMTDQTLKLLQLLQFADSAIPIGSTSHSFGLEMLIEDGVLIVDVLEQFLRDYLHETGALEAAFCYAAYDLLDDACNFNGNWIILNRTLSAMKPARESRDASAVMGRRFLQLTAGLTKAALLNMAIILAKTQRFDIHHATAFGLACAIMGIDINQAVPAYLKQNITGLISTCQRLMPLGQNKAASILWELNPAIETAAQYRSINDIASFMPIIDLASMRHPRMTTRLFIS